MSIAHLYETAITFEGLNIPTNNIEQPEIINPKTGKPYDLNDPEFPVVKGHKFIWRYWAMPKTPQHMLLYLNEHWDYFNRTRFQGKLRKPNISLLRDVNAIKMRLRGLWVPRSRDLKISPNLFNSAHEGWVNRILIHEMCHQEVTELHGGEREEGGHGPKWRAAMTRAGLKPMRYDYEHNENYMDKYEKKVYQEKESKLVEYRSANKILRENREPLETPRVGMIALMSDLQGKIIQVRIVSKKGVTFGVETLENPPRTFDVRKAHLFKSEG